jgi:hypothetical protein
MVLVLVLSLIGVFGLSGAQAQTVTVSPSKGQAVKAPAPVKAPAFPNAVSGDAVLTVTGSALRPRASDITFGATPSGGGIYRTSVATSLPVFNTPLDLPQGTVVKSVRMYFNNTDPSNVCYGVFTCYDLYGNWVAEWWATGAAGSGLTFADSGPINHTIDYTQYTYLLNWVSWAATDAIQLLGLQLYYTPSPLAAPKAVVIPLN